MKFLRTPLILSALLAALGSAQADAPQALARLNAELASARLQLPIATARPTLVHGLYALLAGNGSTVLGYTNEAGTLLGDASGFKRLGPGGVRALTAEEQAALRGELLARIAYERLPKVVYGRGGGRRLLLFSALDCPYCRGLEDSLSMMEDKLDTTLYVVPSSLLPIARGGLPTWEKVARIWCAPEGGNAWLGYWSQASVPAESAPGACALADPRAAEAAREQLVQVLRAVGVRIVAVPQLVREDGSLLRAGKGLETAGLEAELGPRGKPAVPPPSARWLP